MSEKVLDLETGGQMVERATDPLINPAYVQPVDFTAQYPTPLDTTEILRLCEEVSLLQAIPTQRTNLSVFTWREMTALALFSCFSTVSAAANSLSCSAWVIVWVLVRSAMLRYTPVSPASITAACSMGV